MFAKKPRICVQGSSRQSNLYNSLFIQNVREEERRDKILEDVFMRSTAENPYLKKIQSSIQLCEAIRNEKTRQFVQNRRIVIRRNDIALREVEKQLRAAYISKSIAAVRFEARQLEIEEQAQKHTENFGLENARMKAIEFKMEEVEKNQQRKDALKRDLWEQMAYSEEKRQEEKLTVLEDKKMMDEAVRKYREEEDNKKRAAFEKKVKYKADLIEFDNIQEEWKKNHPINDHQTPVGQSLALARAHEMARKALIQRKHELAVKMGKVTHQIKVDQVKVLENLTELLIDERQAKEEAKDIKDKKQKIITKQTVRSDLKGQMTRHDDERLEQRHVDDQLYREELRLLAEFDRLQAIKDEKKREAKSQHRDALLEAICEKQFVKAREMKALNLQHAADRAELIRRKKLTLEARNLMLMEHGHNLKGFIPPRLLKKIDPALLPEIYRKK